MIHKINNTMENRNKNINGPQDKQHNGLLVDKQLLILNNNTYL